MKLNQREIDQAFDEEPEAHEDEDRKALERFLDDTYRYLKETADETTN